MSETVIPNKAFCVARQYSDEVALQALKEYIKIHATRASDGFRQSFFAADLAELKPTIYYAPSYQIYTDGTYEWQERTYQNIGNAWTGDLEIGIDHDKSTDKELSFSYASKKIMKDALKKPLSWIDPLSWTKDKRNILQPIDIQELDHFPLLYNCATVQDIADEIHRRAQMAHEGSYNVNDLSIALVLLPVVEFTFQYEGQPYCLYVNLHNGTPDWTDTDTSPAIEKSFEKMEKFEKCSKWIKIASIAVLVFDFILGVFIKKEMVGQTNLLLSFFMYLPH